MQQLLDAYNEADDELVCTVLSRPLFKYLDNVVSDALFGVLAVK